MTNLWQLNVPENFWLCQPDLPPEIWQAALTQALPVLGIDAPNAQALEILDLTIGEGRFGPDHWKLSLPKKVYYVLKPFLPRVFTRLLRNLYSTKSAPENWPIDARFAKFQLEILRQILLLTGKSSIQYVSIWPENKRFAFVLTHDIETARGQSLVRKVADLEESLGFHSSFNFVLERYPLDLQLMQELRERGFEVGCHGLKHDGKLYSSNKEFTNRSVKINKGMRDYGMTGFRSPLTHRNPYWMQSLDIEYDLSFFDTDPFEPIPGGAMSIWPYFLGHFVELPYTLVQDYTLGFVLNEKTSRLWLEKIDFLQTYQGLALLNSHPDYLSNPGMFNIYSEFLETMKNRTDYWHALPFEAAHWWKSRPRIISGEEYGPGLSTARLDGDIITL